MDSHTPVFPLFKELKPFLTLWVTQSFSQIGSAMTAFALVIWAYQKTGEAMTVSLLSFCSFTPYIIASLFAGPLIDRFSKKHIMAIADSGAALCTFTVLLLETAALLEVRHLFLINTILGLMNAFQQPASTVAVTLLVPRRYFSRASGLQSFSGSLQSIFAPVLATALLAFYGLKAVILIDLAAFCCAFLSLVFFIRIPEGDFRNQCTERVSEALLGGWRFLLRHQSLLILMLFMSMVNFLAAMSGLSILPAMILSRSGNDTVLLGYVTAAFGAGGMAGGLIMACCPEPRRKTAFIFYACAVSFLFGDILLGLGKCGWFWIVAAFGGGLPLPLLNACEMTILRTRIPVQLQGRGFAIRSAMQFGSMPAGYLLGGFLADRVFEPWMAAPGKLQQLAAIFTGTGPGSGMALLFVLLGIGGITISIALSFSGKLKELN